MSHRPPGILRPLVLAGMMSLATAGPAWAHLGSAAQVGLSGPMVISEPIPSSLPRVSDAPESQEIACVLLVVLLVAIAAVQRRRVLVGSGLIVLLTVFAFEDAVHSVHHGLGPGEAKGCPVAAASAHVAGTTVPSVNSIDLLPPPRTEHRLEPNAPGAAASCPGAVQQRAPPA
jgi:hypothetical protein